MCFGDHWLNQLQLKMPANWLLVESTVINFVFCCSSLAKMDTHWQSCSWYSKFCSSMTLLTQADSQNLGGWRLLTAREGADCGGRYFSKVVLLIYKEGAKSYSENPEKWAFPSSHHLCHPHMHKSSRGLSFSQATHSPGPSSMAPCAQLSPHAACPMCRGALLCMHSSVSHS